MNGFQLSYETVLMLSVHKRKIKPNFYISNFKKKGLEIMNLTHLDLLLGDFQCQKRIQYPKTTT